MRLLTCWVNLVYRNNWGLSKQSTAPQFFVYGLPTPFFQFSIRFYRLIDQFLNAGTVVLVTQLRVPAVRTDAVA